MLLRDSLRSTGARFLLSTWHSNQHRQNELIDTLWGRYHMILQPHFYHVGAKESNRKPMLEALVMSYTPTGVPIGEDALVVTEPEGLLLESTNSPN